MIPVGTAVSIVMPTGLKFALHLRRKLTEKPCFEPFAVAPLGLDAAAGDAIQPGGEGRFLGIETSDVSDGIGHRLNDYLLCYLEVAGEA